MSTAASAALRAAVHDAPEEQRRARCFARRLQSLRRAATGRRVSLCHTRWKTSHQQFFFRGRVSGRAFNSLSTHGPFGEAVITKHI